VVLQEPLFVPVVALSALTAVLAFRARGRVPEVLRQVRPLLAEDEPVLGDGVGLARGARGWRAGFRLVVATDRRLLVATSGRSTDPLLLVDVPYERVSRFGVEWKYLGRVGALSLTLAGTSGAPSETHAISAIAPANLLSIAEALEAHGVHDDDPAAVAEADDAWEEARHGDESRGRLFDRAAMSTPEFDRGLWLLLGLAAFSFYLNPFGVGLGMSRDAVAAVWLFIPVACGIAGYVARTRASLAYLVPLNLLVAPTFFFWGAGVVVGLMFVLSALAGVGLWVGAALHDGRAGAGDAPAAPSPEARPERGSLAYALRGLGLIRISGMMLAVLLAVVAVTSAAGFELTSLRWAVDEVTAKQIPVDGRSNLTGNAASLTYTPSPDLREFITDNIDDAHPYDGARWELRSSFSNGYNLVSLAHYVEDPRLDNAAAIADFVARKDGEHTRLAGFRVTHTSMTVDGRAGYVWNHESRNGYWYYAAWFPHPVHTVRVECIAKNQLSQFKRLCAEAVRSLKFQ
jgi:hypothetical protein